MIEVTGLSKRFGRTVAVDDLSFTAGSGTVTGFLGPNGAGKSTTLRMMVGLDRPDAGRVLFDGGTYRELRHPLRTVGALLDAKWTHPRRSARNHLLWLARTNDLPARRVDEVLDLVGLTSVAGRRAGTFSLGMAQRLGLAGALLGDPGILLLDEPVNGLDPEGIHWIRTLVQGLAAEGRAVLISSHLLSEMAVTAGHVVVIGKGKLIAEGPVAEFVERAGGATVAVRGPEPERLAAVLIAAGLTVDTKDATDGTTAMTVTGAPTDRVGQLAADAGLVVYELTLRTASLEEAYIRQTSDALEYRAVKELQA